MCHMWHYNNYIIGVNFVDDLFNFSDHLMTSVDIYYGLRDGYSKGIGS